MAQPTNAGTTTTAQHGGGNAFPPLATQTYPSQIFWLTITFAALFLIVWRVIGPKLSSAISERKERISDDIETASKHRSEAEAALAAYQTALATARTNAHAEAEENRKQVEAEVEKAKAAADAEARESAAKAEAGIAAARAQAAIHVTKAAQDAAAEIVNRLIGDAVPPDEAEAAVKSVGA